MLTHFPKILIFFQYTPKKGVPQSHFPHKKPPGSYLSGGRELSSDYTG